MSTRPRAYAEKTSVPVDRSRAEIDALLARHGAAQRATGSDDANGEAFVLFTLGGRQVRLQVPLPRLGDFPRKGERPRGWLSWTSKRQEAWQQKQLEQANRERWRAVCLLVKAKLEAIAIGVSTPEREFLADIYLPDGRSVHAALAPQLNEAYATGRMPFLLAFKNERE